jgi:hypothetical protein
MNEEDYVCIFYILLVHVEFVWDGVDPCGRHGEVNLEKITRHYVGKITEFLQNNWFPLAFERSLQ